MTAILDIRKAGQVLGRGVATWTANEDSAEVVDFKGFILEPAEPVILSVRNGSATVDLTARYGSVRKCTALAVVPTGVACTMALATDIVTAAAHGLVIGDAIQFGATTGGVTVGTIYYVIATPDANTFQFSTARGGSAFNITADGSNTYSVAEEQMALGTLVAEKFAAGSSTALVAGLKEAVIYGVSSPFRVTLTKSAATAAAFTCYVELRRA